jgi:YVTN family beta-propeller protein
MPSHNRAALLSVVLTAAAGASPEAATLALRSVALPGAPADGHVMMDYIVYDRARHRVWIPAGNTGSVDVLEADDKVARIAGFQTQEMERHGQKRIVGPSSASVGDGVVYVGNRGDSSVCAIDAVALKVGACVKLDSMPDGTVYVAATREVWVTAPRDHSIRILDASDPRRLKAKAKIAIDGEPEGYAVDDARGVFYTNLEDKDRTLAIDLKTRAVTATWMPECGTDGPRGLAIDRALRFLCVACPDHVVVLDAGHDGKRLSRIDTGGGLDNIDYVEGRHEIYAAAATAARLTVARLDAKGQLAPVATVATAPGARNAVATDQGAAYVTDTAEGKILIAAPAPAARRP